MGFAPLSHNSRDAREVPPDRSKEPEAPVYLVSVYSNAGGRVFTGDISLPSLEALCCSKTVRATQKLLDALGAADLSVLREFFLAVARSEHRKGESEVLGVHERIRRAYAEDFDQHEAIEALGQYLAFTPEGDEPGVAAVLKCVLKHGNDRQQHICLGAMVRAEFFSEDLTGVCTALLSHPRHSEHIHEIIRLGLPMCRKLAHELSKRLGDLMGSELTRRGASYEDAADALHTWCRATADHAPYLRLWNSPSATERAVAIEMASRPGGKFEDELHAMYEALHDPERIVVREALQALHNVGVRVRPYAQAVLDVGMEKDDYVTVLALETLAHAGVADHALCLEVFERLQPFASFRVEDEEAALTDPDVQCTLYEMVPLIRAAALLLPELSSEFHSLLSELVEHESDIVARIAVGGLVAARQFSQIEPFLTSVMIRSPVVADIAIQVAASFGQDALPWLRRTECRFLQDRVGRADPESPDVARLRDMTQHFRAEIEKQQKAA